jgi:DNA-binding NarL/FixJ family response regulator
MDYTLRGPLNGLETVFKIRETNHTPVIFLTAYSNQEIVDSIQRLHHCAYLMKPVDDAVLKELIELLLGSQESESAQ